MADVVVNSSVPEVKFYDGRASVPEGYVTLRYYREHAGKPAKIEVEYSQNRENTDTRAVHRASATFELEGNTPIPAELKANARTVSELLRANRNEMPADLVTLVLESF